VSDDPTNSVEALKDCVRSTLLC